jgi:hypothetical protein
MNVIQEIFLRPDVYFRSYTLEEKGWKFPLLVVFCVGIFAGITGWLTSSMVLPALPPEARSMGPLIGIIGFMSAVIVTFLFWILYALVFYILSYLLKGTGSFKETLAVVGIGYLPQVFGTLLTTIIMVIYLPTIRITSLAGIEDAMRSSPMVMMSGILGLIFLLWSANIWIFGIAKVRSLEKKQAILVVGLPVLISLIYTLATTIGVL